MRLFLYIFCVFVSLWLISCTSDGVVYAPVTDATTIDSIPRSGTYRVMPGDTLYSIAWRYGMDYRMLARNNGLLPPYAIHTNQIIYLRMRSGHLKVKTVSSEKDLPPPEPMNSVSVWRWPAKGSVIGKFSEFNKGINIAGRLGDPVYASAAGKVVYCGNGLRGYGNLIIIKHNSHYLTAYAFNRVVYVKADDWVKSRQRIAEMGNGRSQQAMLHFEIRRDGKPEDPLRYLM